MLAKRIIPCLDVKSGKVVKGVQFKNHKIVGDILQLAEYYCESGADELVFYDITASCNKRTVSRDWVKKVAKILNIPFCVAGGIRSLTDAEVLLNNGADKISINSPAIENPNLINQLAELFGSQCVVVGIDSMKVKDDYLVYQYTGSSKKIKNTKKLTLDWVEEIQQRGAGEIVLNAMNQDGTRSGYDLEQLKLVRAKTSLPLIASGGAGTKENFLQVFTEVNVDGALAAHVFHTNLIEIAQLKKFLFKSNVEIRK